MLLFINMGEKTIKNTILNKKITSLLLIFFLLMLLPTHIQAISTPEIKHTLTVSLPDPLILDMPLEQAICHRMSIRAFTGEGITDEELSTILWHAYGYTKPLKRAVHGITDQYPLNLYVLREDGVWKYHPEDHSLSKYRSLDMTWIGQYDTATVKIGITWDTDICTDDNYAGAEIGEVCQNIYFVCNSLNLGTVTTSSESNQLAFIGLPSLEQTRIILPIGHPQTPYQFTYDPIISDLPLIQNSTTTLSEAIINRASTTEWLDMDLSIQEQTQLIWSSYGYSYFIDEVNNVRHKTVPSSHATYPMAMYCVNKTGIYLYQCDTHQLELIKLGDFRTDIADASQSFIRRVPLMILPVLDTTEVNTNYLWAWYYEAAASAHNVLLEATAWDLAGTIIYAHDTEAIITTLGLSTSNHLPMFVIPIGKQAVVQNNEPTIQINQPAPGLYVFGQRIHDLEEVIIIGPLQTRITAQDDHGIKAIHLTIDGTSYTYETNDRIQIHFPTSLLPRNHILSATAFDYNGATATQSLSYIKLL